MTQIKICGIKTPDILSTAATAGARFAGLVFVPESPRYIHPEQARLLCRGSPTGVKNVALFSNPDDENLLRILEQVPVDMIQLHGNESPARVGEIKSRTHLPIIKSFSISNADDLNSVAPFIPVIDWILFDAKAPPHSNISGGHGIPFDWTILKGKKFNRPWMLSGGLTPENVGEALSILAPDAVDVSSGVESTRGVKDAQKIRDFCAAVKG